MTDTIEQDSTQMALRKDVGFLIACIEQLCEATGEDLDHEDAALVHQIERDNQAAQDALARKD